MSHITAYIRSLRTSGFETVRDHFTAKHCRVLDNQWSYMIVPSADYSVYANESLEFRAAVEEAVGTIFRKHDNVLLCFGYPKTHELTETSSCPIEGRIAAYQYLGGTLIRAYFDGYYWRIATNGALDAYNSHWISKKSIGQLFDECLSRIYRQQCSFASSPLAYKLSPGYTYEFILQHPELHLEVFERPFIYHIGTFDNSRLIYTTSRADNIPPPLMTYFDSFEEVVANLKADSKSLGYTLCAAGDEVTQTPRFKILHPNYKRQLALLGRTSNLYLRYLECKAEGLDKELLKAFPSIRHYSSWVEKSLSTIARSIYQVYVAKYIRKHSDTVVNYYHQPILTAVHSYHKRTGIRVGEDSFYGEISHYHPKRINFLLNGLEFIKTGDVNLREEPVVAPVPVPVPVLAPVPAPVPVIAEEDLELDQVLAALDRQEAEPTAEYLAAISEDHYRQLLRDRFMPIVISELAIDIEESGNFYQDLEEYVLADLLDQDFNDVVGCVEEQAILISRIHYFKEVAIAQMYCY
jgi:hypothetical protein